MKSKIKLFTFVILLAGYSLMAQNAVTIPDKPEVVFVEGGTFTMGDGSDSDNPAHTVTLSSYSIGKYPVTVGQYKKFCDATGRSMPEKTPAWGWQDKHPMVYVTYNDAVAYCNWLGEEYGGDWRLPTEAEWEYAARGGNKKERYTYSGGNDLDRVGWYADNAGGQTNSVGRKSPNGLGIYDLSGNVYEWCRDWYDQDYYFNSPQSNPRGSTSGSFRIVRGGSWNNSAASCRVAIRTDFLPSASYKITGFRVVLPQ